MTKQGRIKAHGSPWAKHSQSTILGQSDVALQNKSLMEIVLFVKKVLFLHQMYIII